MLRLWRLCCRILVAMGSLHRHSASGWLVGAQLTYADLALCEILLELSEPDNLPDFATRFNLPQLGAFLDRVASRPRLRDYLTSARAWTRAQPALHAPPELL